MALLCRISGVIHNPEQEILSPEDFDVQAVRGKSLYETKAAIENSSASTFMGEGEETVAESPGLFLIVMVEDGKEPPEEVTLYYNEGLGEREATELWGSWDQDLNVTERQSLFYFSQLSIKPFFA